MHHLYVIINSGRKRLVFTSREDSRVHESGHAEVGEGEEEDHGNVDGNDRRNIL